MLNKKSNLHSRVIIAVLGITTIILLSSTQIYAGYGWGGSGQRSYSGITNMSSINLYESDNNNIIVNNQNIIDNDIYGGYGGGYGWGHGWRWGANSQSSFYGGIANMSFINLYNSDYNNITINYGSTISNNVYNNYYGRTSWLPTWNVAPDFSYGYLPYYSNFSDNNFYNYAPSYNINSFSPNLDGLNWNYY